MIILKELVPLSVLAIALVEIGLERRWRDKRTRIHKIWRKILVVLLFLLTILSMVIVFVDHKKSEELEAKIDKIPENFENIVATLNKSTYKEYYDQAKFNYEAGLFYQHLGKNAKAAEAFLLFRDITLKTNEIQAAALSSLIAASRFQDINDFSKVGELQSEAGDLFTKLNRIEEAILWKKEAIKNYKKVNLQDRINSIEKEIKQLNESLSRQSSGR